jgi:hypothetical protein
LFYRKYLKILLPGVNLAKLVSMKADIFSFFAIKLGHFTKIELFSYLQREKA